MLLAALGLPLTAGGWRAVGWVFSGSDDPVVQVWRGQDQLLPWETEGLLGRSLSFEHFRPLNSPIVRSAEWLCWPFVRIFDRAAGVTPIVYSLLCGLWVLAVWSAIGGAITRIAAVALARDDRMGFIGGLKFGVRKWPSFFFAPLVPFSAVLALLVLGWIAGLLMKWNPAALLVAIFLPILLAACFAVAVLLLGLLFGWPLIWPTISTEGTDSFDGLSRSYSYTFQRPLVYLFFVLVAGFLGALAALIAWLLADWTIGLMWWAVSWGAGVERMNELAGAMMEPAAADGLLSATGSVLAFWNGCVMLLALAYVYSYFWTSVTRIYFLLRQRVDGTELDEVALEEAEGEETYGLPKLSPDESGMPRVDEPAAPARPSEPPAPKPPEAPAGPK